MATETRERITDPERLSRLEGAHAHMATKADLAAVETRVMARIAATEIRVTERIVESEIRLMAKIAETNEKTAKSESRIIKWTVSAFAALASLVVAGGAFLYRLIASLG